MHLFICVLRITYLEIDFDLSFVDVEPPTSTTGATTTLGLLLVLLLLHK